MPRTTELVLFYCFWKSRLVGYTEIYIEILRVAEVKLDHHVENNHKQDTK